MNMITSYINWDVNPEIFNLFGFSLRYYGVLFVGGLLLCIYILKGVFKDEKIPPTYLEKLATYSLIGIFVGARIGHCLFYEPSYYLVHPLEIVLPIQPTGDGGYQFSGFQGLASHGAALGLFIALILYSRKTKESLIRIFDLISLVASLGACFIRLANLMNSEIIGIPTTVPWAFVFVNVDILPRHPGQLYEAISYLFIFGLTYFLYKTKRAQIGTGFIFGLGLSLGFGMRFLIEFIKEKQVPFEQQMSLDMGQILSLPFILLGIGFIVYSIAKSKKDSNRQVIS
jgi:phosphatidylglycerol:prolipoprotein diacylglycerol transferase